ncbi:hypothetical protein [Persicobacter sp. CCB-QB2]|uniref:hypothetical protein n=1 Tax=Persicobacter sp. CCB-QB2 TaxID=1561025 RepID=UPI0006A95323|nr:hypothetical protein [Persicobacter sp. CCB-QB2]
MYQKVGKGYSYIGGTWEEEKVIKFKSRSFGQFTIKYDSIPPKIHPIIVNNKKCKFRITDERSGISSYNAWINDQWLLLHYDYKTNMIWSERLDKTIPLKGLLRVEVTDQIGNKKIYEKHIP